MNYNGCDVVETIYETFARAFASRYIRFADRVRGRTACPSEPPPFSLSGGDAVSLSATAATVRSECRPAASNDESATGNRASADRRHGKQTDQGRSAVRDSGSEQTRIRHEPVRAEFRLRRCPRFPAGDRGQRPVHAKDI